METVRELTPMQSEGTPLSALKANPITTQTEISAYMHWSLPLSVVLSHDISRGWFMERFIQIYAMYFDNPGYDRNYLWVDFYEYKQIFHNPVLFAHDAALSFGDLGSIDMIDYMIHKINAGYYFMVFLDEFCLPGKRSYQKRHFVHPSLLYGYDQKEEKVLSIGFDQSNILAKIDLSFANVSEAFQSAKSHYQTDAAYAEHEIVQFFLPNSSTHAYSMNLHRVFEQLKDYLGSKNNAEKDFVLFQGADKTNKQIPICGLSVYDHVIKNLQLYLENRHTIDYRAIHVLCEHKRAVLSRLQHVLPLMGKSQNLSRLVDEYKPLVTEMDQTRMIYLKCALKASNFQNFYKLPADQNVIEQINNTLSRIKSKESSLLTSICDEMDTLLSNR